MKRWCSSSHTHKHTYLIIWGTVTLEFSSNTLVIKPLQRILSIHCNDIEKNKTIIEGMKWNNGSKREKADNRLSLQCHKTCFWEKYSIFYFNIIFLLLICLSECFYRIHTNAETCFKITLGVRLLRDWGKKTPFKTVIVCFCLIRINPVWHACMVLLCLWSTEAVSWTHPWGATPVSLFTYH